MKTIYFCLALFFGAFHPVFGQLQDSASVRSRFIDSQAFKVGLAPAVLATGSLLLFDPAGGEHTIIHNIPGFSTEIDDYLQFAPIAVVYGLDIAGIEAKNDVLNQTLLLLKAELLTTGLVQSIKYLAAVPRPDGSANNSFPSGHTAQAFLAATFLNKEFGHQSIWVGISSYTMAASVGILRILQDRHRLTDVLMGAGIGILSTNLVYVTHRHRWGRKGRTVRALPAFNNGSYGFYLRIDL